jgi:hypothetical protein
MRSKESERFQMLLLHDYFQAEKKYHMDMQRGYGIDESRGNYSEEEDVTGYGSRQVASVWHLEKRGHGIDKLPHNAIFQDQLHF